MKISLLRSRLSSLVPFAAGVLLVGAFYLGCTAATVGSTSPLPAGTPDSGVSIRVGGGVPDAGGGTPDAGGGTPDAGGSTPDAGGSTPDAGQGESGGVFTEPNLKIAILGDSDSGGNYTAVLNLVKAEGAQAVVGVGDMSYSDDPTAWWSATEQVLGATFPVFIARGNHDDASWSNYLPTSDAHIAASGAVRTDGPHDAAFKLVWKGLSLVAIKLGDTGATIQNLFQNDNHLFKICHWHQNQNAMQVGQKGDEMGWDVYETCRQLGAIIVTGHEHSYERTKTLTNMTSQTIDPTCSTANNVCVSPGRTFVTVAGLGGKDIRVQARCLPSTPPYGCPEWASIDTSNQGADYGAQFIIFNVNGDPHKAHGYFKNIQGQTRDEFDITAN